jgi:CheY-like chemotaxis protein
MPSVLICADGAVDLSSTILWRADVQRRRVATKEEARRAGEDQRFDLIVVDHDVPGANLLVRDLRLDAATRGSSIAVVMGRSEFEPADLDLIDAGANAILRPPVTPDWDRRLSELMRVPERCTGRFPVELRVDASVPTSASPSVLGGTVLNLSEHGMLLETDVPLSLGSDLDFWIYLRDAVVPLRGCGQVVREAGPSRGGIRFYGLEADGLARIRRFVRAAAEAAPSV